MGWEEDGGLHLMRCVFIISLNEWLIRRSKEYLRNFKIFKSPERGARRWNFDPRKNMKTIFGSKKSSDSFKTPDSWIMLRGIYQAAVYSTKKFTYLWRLSEKDDNDFMQIRVGTLHWLVLSDCPSYYLILERMIVKRDDKIQIPAGFWIGLKTQYW